MKKIVTRHVLTEKFPFVVAAILMIVGQILPNYLAATIADPFYDLFTDHELLLILFALLAIALSFLFLVIFERWFYPEYKSSLTADGLAAGMKAALPLILFIIGCRVLKAAVGFERIYPPTLYTVIQGLRAGINEEAAFRGMAVALLLRQFRKKENIWIPAVFTGVLFGCTHLTNIFTGDDPVNVLINVVFASAFGVIFGIVFTFSGNLWPVVLLHSLYDYFAFTTEDLNMPDWPIYAEIAAFVVFMLIYLAVMLRKRESLAAYWDTRWKNEKQ